jgi:ribosome-associated protein
MNVNELSQEIERFGSFTAVRSQGPGGQGVNTTSSKIQLTLDLSNLPSLSDSQRSRVNQYLTGRMRKISDQVFMIQIQNERSQLRNKNTAIHTMAVMISRGLVPVKHRKPTRPTKASVRRRIEQKKSHSRKKRLRSRVDPEQQ